MAPDVISKNLKNDANGIKAIKSDGIVAINNAKTLLIFKYGKIYLTSFLFLFQIGIIELIVSISVYSS